ncbi:UNVERIFIED_CONTAM: hypothetical protein GTU68_020700, partial [Idotea baltica]|nr:hypothetical protein [Idotea baltica]
PARLFDFHKNIYFHEVNSSDYPLFEYAPYETALASRMVDIATHETLDVLHVHYAIPHASAAFMAKSILKQKNINIPVVTTLHGTDITLVGLDRAYLPVVEFSINQSDVVTSVSQSLKKQTEDSFELTTDIDVIYNFIDENKFKRVEDLDFKNSIAPNGEFILSHTSNFRKLKRVDDVIRIFEEVYRKIPCKLLLIGDGPERSSLEALCRTIGLCDEIIFLGKQDAVERLLSISDLFILPSTHESFGLAALEALATEVPVISSNVGGIPEVNVHGETGFLSEVGNVKEMAGNAIKLLQDPTLMKQFKVNAIKKADTFSKAVIVPQYEAVYQKAIDLCK